MGRVRKMPLDVAPLRASRFGLPFSLFTYDNGLTTQLNSSLYEPSATGQLLAPNSITFRYAAGGLEVEKTFTFDTTYVVGVRVEVTRNGAPVRALVAWPAGLGDMEEFLAAAGKRTTFSVATVSPLLAQRVPFIDTPAAASRSMAVNAKLSDLPSFHPSRPKMPRSRVIS